MVSSFTPSYTEASMLFNSQISMDLAYSFRVGAGLSVLHCFFEAGSPEAQAGLQLA